MNGNVGSLTKEFPLVDIERTIALARHGMEYEALRELAQQQTHRDIPALLAHRFLLVREGRIVHDRFLSFVEEEGFQLPRIRKIMYLTWALRDPRLRRFVVERIADRHGIWRPGQLVRKANAVFFQEFFRPPTAQKVRSNVERFFVETGIFNPRTRTVDLQLNDGWLTDAVQVAAQHESDPNRHRAMLNDPVDFLVAKGWNGLANATVDELRGLARSVRIEADAVEDDEIGPIHQASQTSVPWNRQRPRAFVQPTANAQLDLVARERASQAHHTLERIMAEGARAQGFEPRYNQQIDLFFRTPHRTVLAEMKSSRHTNLHAQIRRGISQLFEYEFLFAELLGADVTKVLVVEVQPLENRQWIIDYLAHLGILLVWKNERHQHLETTGRIPDYLGNIVFPATR